MKIQFFNIRKNTLPVLTKDIIATSINKMLFRNIKQDFSDFELSDKPVYKDGVLIASKVAVDWEFLENGYIESRITDINLLDEDSNLLKSYVKLEYYDSGVVKFISIGESKFKIHRRIKEDKEVYYMTDSGSEIDFAQVTKRYNGYGIHEITEDGIKDTSIVINVKDKNSETINELIDGSKVYSLTEIKNDTNEKIGNHVLVKDGNKEYEFTTYDDGKIRYIYPSSDYFDNNKFIVEDHEFIFNRYDERGIPYSALCLTDMTDFDIIFRDKDIYTLDYIKGFRPILKLRCLETLKEFDFGKEFDSIGWFTSKFMNAQFDNTGKLVEFINDEKRYLVEYIDANSLTSNEDILVKVRSLTKEVYIYRAYMKNGKVREYYSKPNDEKGYKDIMYKRFTVY